MNKPIYDSVLRILAMEVPLFAESMLDTALQKIGTNKFDVTAFEMKNAIEKYIEPTINKKLKLKKGIQELGTGIIILDKQGNIENITKSAEKLLPKKWKFSIEKDLKADIINSKNKHIKILTIQITNNSGENQGAVCLISDNTLEIELNKEINTTYKKLTQANIKLKELDQQKDAFISIAAHELKTPLTSIKGFAQILRNKKLKKKDQQEYIELINKNSDRLYNLILDIVDSSRISLGQIKMHKEIVDPQKIIKDIQENMEGQIKEKGVKPIFSIEKKIPKIQADYERLLQVLRNIIINAIHYTNKGTITIKIYKKNKKIQFEVKDTGEGIPKEAQDKLFSRFYQVDASLKRKIGGSGLGLSVCKGLVELMKGKIWLESEEGKGTTFYFTLPIAKGENKK